MTCLPHSCSTCGCRWSGAGTCHCAADACHRTFADIRAFDAHRGSGRCAHPGVCGLVRVERPGGPVYALAPSGPQQPLRRATGAVQLDLQIGAAA